MNMQEKAKQFEELGYVRIPNVLPAEKLDQYSTALTAAVKAQDKQWGGHPNYIDGGMVHNPMTHDPLFMEFLTYDVLNEHLEQLFDPKCTLYAYTTTSMPPSGTNFSNRIHVDCPRLILGYPTNVGVLIAISEFTEDNGASYFMPGSHRIEEQPSEEEFLEKSERMYLKPGEAIMFNARVWHMGGRNGTDEFRHALSINVCRSWMRQRFDYPRLLGPELLKTADERLLRFLGYRVRVPVDLEDYYVPAEDRLYWAGQG